jgi:hypothetical protein
MNSTPLPLEAEVAHQPGDGAAGHRYAFAVQLPPDLPHPVDAEVVPVDTADLRLQLRVADRPGTGVAVLGGVVGARCDLQSVTGQDMADRLDSEHLAVLVDERYERFDGRSSSAAKKAEAAFKISFARRSSAFSARSRLISAASSDVTPGR